MHTVVPLNAVSNIDDKDSKLILTEVLLFKIHCHPLKFLHFFVYHISGTISKYVRILKSKHFHNFHSCLTFLLSICPNTLAQYAFLLELLLALC